jgi:hypothetical protein
MFSSPQISSQLARERRREMLAGAKHRRTARRLVAESRATRRVGRASGAGLRLRRALRIAARA